MADTLYGLPIASLTSKKPESSDKLISYDDNEKQAHVTTAGELAETMNENLSDAFSSSKSYSAGDYCIYNDTLYKFTADHSGAWDNDDVEAVTVGEELNELNTNLSNYIILADITAPSSVTIPANGSISVSNYIDAPEAPDGYKVLYYLAYASGNPDVVSCGMNSTYVKNTGSSSATVTLHRVRMLVRDI